MQYSHYNIIFYFINFVYNIFVAYIIVIVKDLCFYISFIKHKEYNVKYKSFKVLPKSAGP